MTEDGRRHDFPPGRGLGAAVRRPSGPRGVRLPVETGANLRRRGLKRAPRAPMPRPTRDVGQKAHARTPATRHRYRAPGFTDPHPGARFRRRAPHVFGAGRTPRFASFSSTVDSSSSVFRGMAAPPAGRSAPYTNAVDHPPRVLLARTRRTDRGAPWGVGSRQVAATWPNHAATLHCGAGLPVTRAENTSRGATGSKVGPDVVRVGTVEGGCLRAAGARVKAPTVTTPKLVCVKVLRCDGRAARVGIVRGRTGGADSWQGRGPALPTGAAYKRPGDFRPDRVLGKRLQAPI